MKEKYRQKFPQFSSPKINYLKMIDKLDNCLIQGFHFFRSSIIHESQRG